MAKLKVYRTAVGFRDAYVAAPGQAAALRAWGTEKNLFSRGMAEVVTDAALMEEPLSKPGDVVYRTRGNLKEQVAALGKLPRQKARKEAERNKASDSPKQPSKRSRPKPSRAKLDDAERAIGTLEEQRAQAEADMRQRERALAAQRAAMDARFAKAMDQLKASERKAREAYEEALRQWEP
ncbi:hypothetical protein ABVV53_06020 [Novosphingobium sp. RD2P27]|uniref:Cell envelope biogenesis protein TolA n=1 Tax=Novosphingobium kalidii TaxID=3230299 RepID=A0ABV2CZJ5_9SPHN